MLLACSNQFSTQCGMHRNALAMAQTFCWPRHVITHHVIVTCKVKSYIIKLFWCLQVKAEDIFFPSQMTLLLSSRSLVPLPSTLLGISPLRGRSPMESPQGNLSHPSVCLYIHLYVTPTCLDGQTDGRTDGNDGLPWRDSIRLWSLRGPMPRHPPLKPLWDGASGYRWRLFYLNHFPVIINDNSASLSMHSVMNI